MTAELADPSQNMTNRECAEGGRDCFDEPPLGIALCLPLADLPRRAGMRVVRAPAVPADRAEVPDLTGLATPGFATKSCPAEQMTSPILSLPSGGPVGWNEVHCCEGSDHFRNARKSEPCRFGPRPPSIHRL